MSANYEVRVGGAVPEDAADVFGGLATSRDGDVTVVRGELDQAALHGLLERIHARGLELLTARRIRTSASSSPSGDEPQPADDWPG